MSPLTPSSDATFPQVSPGVVTGEDYRTLVSACQKGRYALPAVNVSSSSAANAVLEAAHHNQADIVIQISASGAHFYAGNSLPSSDETRALGAVALAQHVHLLAQHYGVAVILHTDHADRSRLGWLNALIAHNQQHYTQTGRPLFSSHMLDLSSEPVEENIATAATLLKRLAPLNIGLEIELGMTGGEEDGLGHELSDNPSCNLNLYTHPTDVLTAWRKLSPLGMLSIAASFGNVHGVYKPGKVQLRPDLLQQSQTLIAATLDTPPNPVPFVFHGGSGSALADIRQAVEYGVFKFNIDTDTQFATSQGVANYIAAHKEAFIHQVSPNTGKPLKKFYDVRQWMRAGEKSCCERLNEAFLVLGSHKKSIARRP